MVGVQRSGTWHFRRSRGSARGEGEGGRRTSSKGEPNKSQNVTRSKTGLVRNYRVARVDQAASNIIEADMIAHDYQRYGKGIMTTRKLVPHQKTTVTHLPSARTILHTRLRWFVLRWSETFYSKLDQTSLVWETCHQDPKKKLHWNIRTPARLQHGSERSNIQIHTACPGHAARNEEPHDPCPATRISRRTLHLNQGEPARECHRQALSLFYVCFCLTRCARKPMTATKDRTEMRELPSKRETHTHILVPKKKQMKRTFSLPKKTGKMEKIEKIK